MTLRLRLGDFDSATATILFASATRTSIDGLRDSMFPSHVPG